jgi:phenylacetate-CoA ligase
VGHQDCAEGTLDPAGIARLLDDGVARTAAYACANSPFYRERFDAAGLRPADIASTRDLRRLPPTTKHDVSASGERMWCVPWKRVVDLATTSGTTGLPTLYPLTEADIRRLGYNEFLSFTCAGLTPDDVAIVAVTLDKCFMAGLAYFEGLRQIGATAVRVGSGSPVMLLSLVERLEATAIVSVPSFLDRIARHAAETGLDLAGSSVRKLICIGEPLRGADFQLSPPGAQLSRAWGARMYSTYGVTELAGSLCECDAGQGGHLHPELLHVEILDAEDRPVPDGEIGEVVATTIGVEALPLLRFRTGDLAFLRRERCACGLWTPRLGPIVGRKNQMMKLKGTTVFPAAVERALSQVEQVVDYVMIVTSSAPLADELEVAIAVKGDEAAACQRARDVLRGELKVTPSVRVAPIEEIVRLQEPEGSRKKRVFIDRRS